MGRIAQSEFMPEFTGCILNGRLRLLESLGSGAYGKVYRAIDCTSSSRPKFYAVKCLNKPEPGSHTDVLQQREFGLHKLVSAHPNIVTFHQVFRDDSFVYVVLDLCIGGDLFAAITERHIFHNNGRLIKTAFIQLIDAVQYCHDLGVFHRDIKPENVLCSQDGTDIRLADFGLSIQSSVCHDFGCGSSYYMSPECIGKEITTGKYSTRHNDVWALGIILTNMITGRNPWRYATADDDCFAAYLHDNDFLRQVLPISAEVNTVLKMIFTINPLRRISLPSLRGEIFRLNAFFIDDQPAIPAKTAQVRNPKPEPQADTRLAAAASSIDTLVSSIPSSSDSESSDERYVFGSPVVDHPPVQSPAPVLFPDVVRSGNLDHFSISDSIDSLSVPLSASSGSSGPESKGPITPATYAVEPSVSVPDIPEEEGLGVPVELPHSAFITKFDHTPVKHKKPKSHLFRSAVQRLKGLSTAST
ncbi:hypothetical protein GALMADRAFT_219458 [Galerina marginata CBS 339.88]|uniref:Protein kinase domain-containing protein n=1 Tax=Galerina marginata (strain CBS 339.88) TaxID=685588 RepID=A0A067TUN7_GALM3|nr:hypothetical protein GALMADRAFT_219458 [Galerina marginata CBS 339.88]